MAFQFQCPQGHLLEAEEMDAGKTCQCPYCGLTLAIPVPAGRLPQTPPTVTPFPPSSPASSPVIPAVPSPAIVSTPAGTASESPPVIGRRRRPALDASQTELNFGEEKKRESSTVDVTKKEELFHIPCPNGHELEVPREMLEQTALCPHCNSQFKLRERDSVEAKRKKVIREEQQERQTSNTWLHWIVGISVAVLLFLLALVFLWSG